MTDANVVLGRINPNSPMGGTGHDASTSRARARPSATLGEKLGLGVEETAEAILAVVNQRMAGRIRLLSIERGLDPRDFALVAFGGAGPVHGGALMREVGIGAMLVPLYPGVLCAWAAPSPTCATTSRRRSSARSTRLEPGELRGDPRAPARARARQQLAESDGRRSTRSAAHHVADMAYSGQIHSLRVPIEPGWGREQMARPSTSLRQEFGNTLGDIPVDGRQRCAPSSTGMRRTAMPPAAERTPAPARRRRSRAAPSISAAGTTRRSTAATTSRPA